MKNLNKLIGGMTVGLALAAGPALAEYPQDNALEVIVAYSPGGTSDTLFRALQPYLEEELGTDVVVRNINGGGGAVGWTQLKNTNPDGYTIGHYSNGMAVLESTGAARLSYSDFDPIAQFGRVFLTVTANADSEYDSLETYVQAAKAAPGEISLAMGRGTLSQFVAAAVQEGIDAELQLVNAGGGAEKKAALLGGHVDAIVEPTPGVFAQSVAGEFNILAVLAPERLAFAPDLPTATEQGYDIVEAFISGLIAPKGMDPEQIQIIADAVERATQNPEYIEKAEALKEVTEFQGPEEFGQTMADAAENANATAAELGF